MGASAGCVLVCICASVGFTPFVPTQYRVGGDSGWGSGNDNNKGRHGIAANDKLWRNDGVRWVRLRRILGLRQGKDNGCQQQSWGVIITQRGGQRLCLRQREGGPQRDDNSNDARTNVSVGPNGGNNDGN